MVQTWQVIPFSIKTGMLLASRSHLARPLSQGNAGPLVVLGYIRSSFLALGTHDADSAAQKFRLTFTEIAEKQDAVTAMPAHNRDVPLTGNRVWHGYIPLFEGV